MDPTILYFSVPSNIIFPISVQIPVQETQQVDETRNPKFTAEQLRTVLSNVSEVDVRQQLRDLLTARLTPGITNELQKQPPKIPKSMKNRSLKIAPKSLVQYVFDDSEDHLPMSKEELREFSVKIGELPTDYLTDVTSIYEEHEGEPDNRCEHEIDFELLKPSTLREMEAYVTAAHEKIKKTVSFGKPRGRSTGYSKDGPFSHISVLGKKCPLPREAPASGVEYTFTPNANLTPMEFKQIETLAERIKNLPSEYLPKVADIVKVGEGIGKTVSKDTFVDFETMKIQTLRELEAYVAAAIRHQFAKVVSQVWNQLFFRGKRNFLITENYNRRSSYSTSISYSSNP